MKAQLAFGLLVVLISSISLSTHEAATQIELSLEFDHASREGITQDSNRFIVDFNGVTRVEWFPSDYNLHHESLLIYGKPGVNRISFIGSGVSDGAGTGIDNVKVLRKNQTGGWQDLIINGGFQQGHNFGTNWSDSAIFPNGKITGWTTTDSEIEIGWSQKYNKAWPYSTHICELDANHNTNLYQEFTL